MHDGYEFRIKLDILASIRSRPQQLYVLDLIIIIMVAFMHWVFILTNNKHYCWEGIWAGIHCSS